MWVVATRGFYSMVANRDVPEMVLVRGHLRSDLELLSELVLSLDTVGT